MLLPSSRLLNTPVMSLQTGRRLATTVTAIIDPRTLQVLAFELSGQLLDQKPSFLTTGDIREVGSMGIIVDSSDEFVGINDVIKVKEVYDFQFSLDGIAVKSAKGARIGKVVGYSIEPENFIVKQLNVRRPLLKSLTDAELLIDRDSIVEISNDVITIEDEELRSRTHVKAAPGAYTNPFRQTATPQPETIDRQ